MSSSHRGRHARMRAGRGAHAAPRRPTFVALAATVAALLLVAVIVAIGSAGEKPRTAPAGTVTSVPLDSAVSASPAASPPMPASGSAPGRAGDDGLTKTSAVGFYREKDPDGDTAEHVTDVLWSGSYLRVYTDLRESDDNADPAVSLCEWTAEYLADRFAEADPVVFVHAKKSGNGNVVIANKVSAKDSCGTVTRR